MRAATQSCSGITVVSKSRQNPRSSAKEPILQLIRKLESCNLAKKEPPPLQARDQGPYPDQFSKDLTQTKSYYLLHSRISRTPIFQNTF